MIFTIILFAIALFILVLAFEFSLRAVEKDFERELNAINGHISVIDRRSLLATKRSVDIARDQADTKSEMIEIRRLVTKRPLLSPGIDTFESYNPPIGIAFGESQKEMANKCNAEKIKAIEKSTGFEDQYAHTEQPL